MQHFNQKFYKIVPRTSAARRGHPSRSPRPSTRFLTPSPIFWTLHRHWYTSMAHTTGLEHIAANRHHQSRDCSLSMASISWRWVEVKWVEVRDRSASEQTASSDLRRVRWLSWQPAQAAEHGVCAVRRLNDTHEHDHVTTWAIENIIIIITGVDSCKLGWSSIAAASLPTKLKGNVTRSRPTVRFHSSL